MQSRGWIEDQLLASLERFWGKSRLTVLAYHRIREPMGFEFFEPIISAPPAEFARQMDVMSDRYNAVTLAEVLQWLDGKGSLPPNAALITFDDGYRDNLQFALPILEERDLPAVLFLPTEHIDRAQPFFWDSAAYFFGNTEAREADLPILGARSWTSASLMCAEWLEAVKRIPHSGRAEATEHLGRVLDVALPPDVYAGELLTWDEVRTMGDRGFSFGSHTMSHPILTQLPLEHVWRELAESRARLERELEEPIRALAYPNGTPADFNAEIEGAARDTGYSAAFTLVPGPMRATEALEDPFEIRRIGIYLPDQNRRFGAKLAGGGRVKSSLS